MQTSQNALLIKNIKEIFLGSDRNIPFITGAAFEHIPSIKNAYIWIEGGNICKIGSMDDCPTVQATIIDASNKYVLPSFIDSHTHLVFPAWRENEFVDRIKGLSYQEIAAKGGGILNTAAKLHNTPFEILLEQAYHRLTSLIKLGTGAIEIKSGYGLSVEGELKMLRVIRDLKKISPIPIKANFLGAHAYPSAFKQNHEAYLDLIINHMLPQIADEQLADYCDAFCEDGFFSVEETDRILTKADSLGLKAKIHVNQFTHSGGIQMAIQHKALSVDHLEVLNTEEIHQLAKSSTIATLLPGASFFLHHSYPPGRQLIDSGARVSIASDFNPGTSPNGNLAFTIALSCIKMGMLPEEALVCATINAAYALELQEQCGSIEVGKAANILITKEIPSLAFIPYAMGNDWLENVVIQGKIYAG